MPGSQEIDISYTLDITNPYIPESEIEAYKKFRSQVETELNIELTDYSDATTGASTLLPISISIIAILGLIFILRRLYRWDPVAKQTGYAYDQIGGLLILPLIGLCITPIWVLITFFSAGFFSAESWSGYFILGHPNGTYLIILVLAELIYNIALIGYSIILIILFFKRRTSTPRLMVIFYIVVAFFTYTDYVAVQWILDSYSVLTEQAETKPGDLIRPLIGVFLWAPYFYYSERAAGTFSVRLLADETEEEELPDETEEEDLLSSAPSE
jgi:hypothetical protein